MEISSLDTQSLWEESLTKLQTEISPAAFQTWFKGTFIDSVDHEGTVYLGTPNEFVKEWLATKFQKTLLRILREINDSIRAIEFTVSRKNPITDKPKSEKKPIHQQLGNELPISDLYVNKLSNLNTRYTFDNYILGTFNEIAYHTAVATVNEPGKYNPLFIFGPTGIGKTHLIQATGNAFREKHPELSVFYTSSDKFITDIINSFVNPNITNSINNLKNRYTKYDVFIVDDIQFVGGKEKVQEILFNIFNELHNEGKQIIFSSDKHPSLLQGFESRMTSRFQQGMTVDVSLPDYESRYVIIKRKAEKEGVVLPEEIISAIAEALEGNIRELEGMCNLVITTMKTRPEVVTPAFVGNLLKNSQKAHKSVSIEDIVKIVANYFNQSPEELFDKTRRKEVVHVRQVAMYILREDYNISFPNIGKEFGGRDHTTVIHSVEKVKDLSQNDAQMIHDLETIRGHLATR
ncbi:MAG TPA: chromosomal replication initiator protein DnaA [Candidatus Paceibacterota bacterium]